MSGGGRGVGMGVRLFRTATAAFPGAFRRAHRAEMVETFRRELERVRAGRGRGAAAWFAARSIGDAIAQGLRERVRGGPAAGHGAPSPPPRPRAWAGLGADVRDALRGVRRAPGLALAAVVVLSLGIGANTAVFSALRVVILSPPPYPEPDRLVFLHLTQEHRGRGDRRLTTWSYPKFEALRGAGATMIESLAGYTPRAAMLRGSGPAVRVGYELVSPPYFALLGVAPATGRFFTADEDQPGDPPAVAVLSHELWRGMFRGDPAVLGSTVTLNGTPVQVVGVAPEGFTGITGEARLWVPIALADLVLSPSRSTEAGNHWFHVVGRVAPSTSIDDARAQVSEIGRRIGEAYPSSDAQVTWAATVRGLQEVRVNEEARAAVVLLAVAAALVLLVSCANLSGLLLARARRTSREGAIRLSLGAPRWRIVRGSLIESLMLAGVGGGLGVLVALWGTWALRAAWPSRFLSTARGEMRAANPARLGVDPDVVTFAVLASLVTAILFGLAPALRLSRANVSDALGNGGRATRAGTRRAGVDARVPLVGLQVALALVLLVGTGLVASSLARLLEVDEGFRTENLLTFTYAVPETSSWSERGDAFRQELAARLVALPAVERLTWGSQPLGGYWAQTRLDQIEGDPPLSQGEGPVIGVHMVGEGWFETLEVPLRRGRYLDGTDGTDFFPTVVVDERTARELFGEGEPLGRRIRLGLADPARDPYAEIVGVVGDVLHAPPDQPRILEAYYAEREYGASSETLLVRTRGEPLDAMPAVRRIGLALEPGLAIYGVTTMDAVVRSSVGDRRLILALLGLFAAVAVLLAATGTWGIVSCSIADRRRELGLRKALGAGDGRLIGLVAVRSASAAAAGVAVGLPCAAAASRLLETFLWETPPRDPLVMAAGAGLLLGVVLAATWIPARAVLRLDPAEVLRRE